MLSILLQAAAPAPTVENVQLACTLAMPSAPAASVNIDLKTKKLGVAALTADAGPLARVASASPATPWQAGGTDGVAFAVATGNGQYRVELAFTDGRTAGAARVRVVTLGGDGALPLIGQGFCTTRSGKRLPDKKLTRLAFDATSPPARPVKLQAGTPTLPAGVCRVVGPDRAIHRLDYTVLSAVKNEATLTYKLDNAAFAGTAGGTGTGVLFNLASPRERLYALTVGLNGQPPLYVHQTFEQSGIWVDLTRGKTVLGLGECGPVPPALLMGVAR